MADAKEDQKLLKPPKNPKKTPNNPRNERMCGFCHKPMHLKEHCHWNPKNPNNKLKDKKRILVNEVSPKTRGRMGGNHKNQGNKN